MSANLWVTLIIVIALFAGLLVPYLVEEITRGKVELGPRVPTGAGDTHPDYAGDGQPAQPVPQPVHDRGLSLRSFHTVLISLSIVLASGTGVWALFHDQLLLGVLALSAAVALIVYGSFFVWKAENAHLD